MNETSLGNLNCSRRLVSLQTQTHKKPLHPAHSQNPICPHQKLFLFAVIPAYQYLGKCSTKVVLDQYGFAHRWLFFLCRNKIITTRFRAWQRFPLFMPELFYPLSLSLPSFPHAGQALSISTVIFVQVYKYLNLQIAC